MLWFLLLPLAAARCGPGYYEESGLCVVCPQGKAGNGTCETCPAGRVPNEGRCFGGGAVPRNRIRSFDGSCYFFSEAEETWTKAERECLKLGGHLVVFNGHTEADEVARLGEILHTEDFWIGLNERGNKKAFDWSNPNVCSDYRNWGIGAITCSNCDNKENNQAREPTDDSGKESYRCVRSDRDARLYDEKCRKPERTFVCEAPVREAATTCSKCRMGYYAAAGDIECRSCEFGRYATKNGAGECDVCPTMSPARLLANHFTPQGSVQCGGNLGRRQRDAYLAVCCMSAVAPFFLTFLIAVLNFEVAPWFVARGLAAFPTRNEQYRGAVFSMGTPVAFFLSPIAGALMAEWLEPHNQQVEDWPYKGRRTASTLQKGCDPAETAGIFFMALSLLCLVGLFLLLSLPIVNVVELAHIATRMATRHHLRRQFERQRRKFEYERLAQAKVLRKSADEDDAAGKSSFACTLCRSHRANALNTPCAHQFFCVSCAEAFRAENGPICNACRQPSVIHDVLVRGTTTTGKTDIAGCFGPGQPTAEVPPLLPRSASSSSQPSSEMFGNAAELEPGQIHVELQKFDAKKASIEKLADAVVAAKRVRAGVRQQFLASTCAMCAAPRRLVVDVPCGHATLCKACSRNYRERHGDVCPRCQKPSTPQFAVSELSCSVCFDVVPAEFLVGLGTCGHHLCTACTTGYVRSALANVRDQVTPDGLRCPLGGCDDDNDEKCKGIVSRDVIGRLLNRPIRDDMRDSVLPLTQDEYDRLERFIYEASIPVNERFNCCWSDCSRVFAVPYRDLLVQKGAQGAKGPEIETIRRLGEAILARFRRIGGRDDTPAADDDEEMPPNNEDEETKEDPGPSFEGDPPFVTCIYCERQSCVRCKVPAHPLLTCEEVHKGASSQATNAFIEATSKACPTCSFRITHYHGHACHHILPGTGCPNCGTHFCYTCRRKGTSGSSCGCRLFCNSADIQANLVLTPFPHDRRCSCPICPDCKPGQPCNQCSGGCVVCRGVVPPAPRDAKDVATWNPRVP